MVAVQDGDTLTLLDASNHQTKVRLAEIDAPELSQSFGNQSKKALSALVFGKSVTVEVATKDKYGRTVGRVFVGAVHANAEVVKAGMAWVYRKYPHSSAMVGHEALAKVSRAGLWAQPEPKPPWEYRNGPDRSAKPAHSAKEVSSWTKANCIADIACADIRSCEVAMFFFRTCGVKTLDYDNDGTPCEAVCKGEGQ